MELMRKILILLTCCSCFFASGRGQAQNDEDMRFLRSVIIEKGETSPGDIICILCSVTVKGKVPGDVIAIGGDLTVTGSIHGDAIAAGGRVSVLPGGRIDGDPIAVGGSVRTSGRVTVPAERVSVPYFHLPGQRSFDPLGVLSLAGFMLLVTAAAAAILRTHRSAGIADDLRRRPWLALLLGLAGWTLYLFLEEQLDTDGTLATLGYWMVSGLVLALLLIGYAGLVWLVGRLIARQHGGKNWVAGSLIVTIALLVPVAGALFVSLLLVLTMGSGIERTARSAAAIIARRRARGSKRINADERG